MSTVNISDSSQSKNYKSLFIMCNNYLKAQNTTQVSTSFKQCSWELEIKNIAHVNKTCKYSIE